MDICIASTGQLDLLYTITKNEFGSFNSPLVYQDHVYWAGADKHIHCLDLQKLQIIWSHSPDYTRIFSSPVIINNSLYIGTNAGRLHELDPHTGESRGYFQARERITNQLIYNNTTNTYFLPTYANEIISLVKNVSGTRHDISPRPRSQ